MKRTLTLFFIFVFISLNAHNVKLGSDVLLSTRFDLIKNKNIGIVTNHTGVLSNGIHIVDTLIKRNNVNVIKLFSPEHGIRGKSANGSKIKDGIDPLSKLPVISLYGINKKPTKEKLENIDLLLFDIQDVGARFYTYISTLYYVMQSCAENNLPLIVLDRPNPLSGNLIDGPILDPEFKSFVGVVQIPVAHGMTIGEIALMMNEAGMLGDNLKCNLQVIKMKNWKRSFYFDDCGLKWIPTSPNIPTFETALVYPGICLLEGTNISEGRGTGNPFIVFGSSFIKSNELKDKLKVDGVKFHTAEFTPVSIKGVAKFPKFENQKCSGLEIEITNKKLLKPVELGVKVIYELYTSYKRFEFKKYWIDKLYGSSKLRNDLEAGRTPEEIISSWKKPLNKFKQFRKQFLLYN